MGLDIDADLVVLSACQTALGKITGGDDVIGLSRGLFSAGARSALVTLWEINDLSTSLFMADFFRYFQKHQSSFQKTLQHAQQYLYQLDKDTGIQDFQELESSVNTYVSNNDLPISDTARGLMTSNAAQKELTDYSHPYYWAGFSLMGM